MMSAIGTKSRITLGSFLAYFVMSAVISPLGLISAPIARHFEISITTATAAFTYLTSGVFVGTLIAIFIFDFVKLRQVIASGAAIICLSIYAIYAIDSFGAFAVALAAIGISCGIELSAAAVVITKIFDEKLRASMLLLTDSFYSIAGVISTSLAGVLLANQLHWSSVYLLAFFVTLVIAVIAMTAQYPATRKEDAANSPQAGSTSWPVSVHLIGFALLIYLVGFVTIYTWVPNFAQATLSTTAATASEIVSRFFLGLFVGQLIMFFLVLTFPLRTLIVVYAAMATVLTASLWSVDTANHLQISMLTLGLVTGGLFKTVITFGTTLVSEPSPKMVSYLIFHAGLGTAIAPFISSYVVEQTDMVSALKLVTFCYVCMFALIVAAGMLGGTRHDDV